MREPHCSAGGTIAGSPLVLVDAVTDEGIADHGILTLPTPTRLPMPCLEMNMKRGRWRPSRSSVQIAKLVVKIGWLSPNPTHRSPSTITLLLLTRS